MGASVSGRPGSLRRVRAGGAVNVRRRSRPARVGHAGPDRWVRGRVAGVRALSAVACGVLLVAVGPWLSESASAQTGEPSPSASSEPSPSPSEPSASSSPSAGPSAPSCATSSGAQEFPASGTARYSLPGWVPSPVGPVCVVLDGSSLVDSQATQSPAPVPSNSPELQELQAQVSGFRELFLYSGGVLICLTAAILWRTRRVS